MKHGSLFSGIGGFDLAAEWMGWENVFHCEINTFGRKILKHYWPNAISYEDITKTDFTIHRGKIDILSGGFPCQPYSVAGKRKGKEDSRHLWPKMLEAIRTIQPRWIVGENVLGIIDWNSGLVFNEIQTDLETSGYSVFAYVLPACGLNAPHQRYRTWFVAHTNSNGCYSSNSNKGNIWKQTPANKKEFECSLQTNRSSNEQSASWKQPRGWQRFPSKSGILSGNDGIPRELDDITFSSWAKKSIEGYGNAIVPQVAFEIFKAIEKIDGLK